MVRDDRAVVGRQPPERKAEVPYFQEWLTGRGYEAAPYALSGGELGYEVVPPPAVSPRWYDVDPAVAVIGDPHTLALPIEPVTHRPGSTLG